MTVTTKDTKPSKKPKSKKPTNTKPNTPTSLPLTNRQKKFAENYTDPNSPTFLNGTHSVIASGHTKNPESAAVIASRSLRRDNVLSYIEQLNKQHSPAAPLYAPRTHALPHARPRWPYCTNLPSYWPGLSACQPVQA